MIEGFTPLKVKADGAKEGSWGIHRRIPLTRGGFAEKVAVTEAGSEEDNTELKEWRKLKVAEGLANLSVVTETSIGDTKQRLESDTPA